MMPEGEKNWGCQVGTGLTDLPNIGGPVAPPVPASLTLCFVNFSRDGYKIDRFLVKNQHIIREKLGIVLEK